MDASHSHFESELEPSRKASCLYMDFVGKVDVLLTPYCISWLTTGNTNVSSLTFSLYLFVHTSESNIIIQQGQFFDKTIVLPIHFLDELEHFT